MKVTKYSQGKALEMAALESSSVVLEISDVTLVESLQNRTEKLKLIVERRS